MTRRIETFRLLKKKTFISVIRRVCKLHRCNGKKK